MSDHTGSHIGTLIKPHGYKGEIQVKGFPHLLNQIQIGDPLFISIDGQRIPFFIEDIFDTSQPDRCVIKFEFIDDDAEARKFLDCELFIKGENPKVSDEKSDLSSMLNFDVYDPGSKKSFVVSDFVESPENPLLILLHGKQEIMLPLNADYIESIDHEAKKITVHFPDGLVDI